MPLTPEERKAQYDAYAKRYQARKVELMATGMREPDAGNQALRDTDREFGFK